MSLHDDEVEAQRQEAAEDYALSPDPHEVLGQTSVTDSAHPHSDESVSAETAPKPVQKQESTLAVVAAIIGNVLVGVVKFIAAAITGSSAMLSEGIHSVVDSGNDILVLVGIKRSKHAPDREHPFGYGKEVYFWTLVVAILIFALGGGVALYEGITNIMHATHGGPLGDPTMNYIVIAAAAVIEGTSLTIAIRQFNRARGDMRPMEFIRYAKDPSLFTVVLEDSAAEAGLLFAFLGVLLTHLTGDDVFDGIASVLIGLLLAAVAITLLRETKGLLVGEGLRPDEVAQIEAIVEADPYVLECGRILSLYMGPHDLLLTMDVTFTPEAGRDDIVSSIDAIEAKITDRFPDANRIFIETESLRYTRSQDAAKRMFYADDDDAAQEAAAHEAAVHESAVHDADADTTAAHEAGADKAAVHEAVPPKSAASMGDNR